jgi:hypothetical protein
MIELHSFGPWIKCYANIVLLCFFKLPIMLEIILWCNMDIIPTWCVGKSISQLTHFEKNYICTCYEWYEFYMNGYVNQISRPTPFLETSNENWNGTRIWMCEQVDMMCMDIHMRYSSNEDVVLWNYMRSG